MPYDSVKICRWTFRSAPLDWNRVWKFKRSVSCFGYRSREENRRSLKNYEVDRAEFSFDRNYDGEKKKRQVPSKRRIRFAVFKTNKRRTWRSRKSVGRLNEGFWERSSPITRWNLSHDYFEIGRCVFHLSTHDYFSHLLSCCYRVFFVAETSDPRSEGSGNRPFSLFILLHATQSYT